MGYSDGHPAAPRGSRLRILFVARHLPVPVRGGSSQRSHLILEMLGRLGEVEIAAIGDAGLKAHLEDHGYTVAGILPPESDALGARIARILMPASRRYRAEQGAARRLRAIWEEGRFDIAIGRYLGPSARAGLLSLPRVIVDIDDLESQKLSSWADGRGVGSLLAPLVGRMERVEKALIAGLDRAWVSAPDDRPALEPAAIDVVPNIPFTVPAPGSLAPSPDGGAILFVASWDYRVNRDALRDFVRTIWPAIRADRADAVLRVVGGGLDAAVSAEVAQAAGVELAGFVDDLAGEYARAAFSIVPIWEGGGTKIKILESLAFGRTAVVAAPSMRGYRERLHDEDALLVADDRRAFAVAVRRLIDDPANRHRLERRGQEVVAEHYSRDGLAACVRASVLAALGREDGA